MPCRERTNDFLKVTEAIRGTSPKTKVATSVAPPVQKSSFSLQAARIREALNGTTSKLSKLARLAKSKTYAFGDPVEEIDELSYVIKEDIKSLQGAVQDMQNQLKNKQADTAQEQQHSQTVVAALQFGLKDTATTFQEVLQTRAQSMQEQQNRLGQFSSTNGSTRRGLGGFSRGSMQIPGLDFAGSAPEEDEDTEDHSVINMSALMEANPQNEYLESRAVAVENIQKNIVELAGVFEQLATTVEQQRLMLQTVDNNVEDAVVSVTEAQDLWTQYLASISSDRMLAMKVFGILITFAMFFIVFLK